MKTLLRTILLALLVFAGYAAFATDTNRVAATVGTPPQTPGPCGPGSSYNR